MLLERANDCILDSKEYCHILPHTPPVPNITTYCNTNYWHKSLI
uniref:Uncharacterized protein n=1 Tax=Anguilla anguilla TaxID=7936 RepID=A0A0E9RVN3_ANGAN